MSDCGECNGTGVAERIGGYDRPCDACHGEGIEALAHRTPATEANQSQRSSRCFTPLPVAAPSRAERPAGDKADVTAGETAPDIPEYTTGLAAWLRERSKLSPEANRLMGMAGKVDAELMAEAAKALAERDARIAELLLLVADGLTLIETVPIGEFKGVDYKDKLDRASSYCHRARTLGEMAP